MTQPLIKVRPSNLSFFLFAIGLNFCALLLFATTALAQSSLQNPPGILMAATDQGVRYLTGGIGSEEREAMETLGTKFNLKLIFAELSGDYIAGVAAILSDQHGKELGTIITNGPWLYVQLSPGTYRVRATLDGVTQEIAKLRIREHGQVVRFMHWDLDEE
jgi:hypothetical protein